MSRAPGERAIVGTVALTSLLAPLNSTMIAVALPRIIDDFGATVRAAGWLITSYLIALAVVQPVAGRMGDALGRRLLMLAGLAAFGFASACAALAPTLAVLTACRVGQAVAVATVFPNGAALLRAALPAQRRARGFGTLATAVAGAAVVGPLAGGLLAALGGWRVIFAANVPIVLASIALTWRNIPAGAAEGGPPAPLFGLAFFRRRRFAAAAGGVAFSNLAFYALVVAAPLLLSARHKWSSFDIGLALAALAAPTALFAPMGGRLSDRLGRRRPALVGHALLTAAALPLVLDPTLGPEAFVACLAVAGSGVGLSAATLQASAVESAPARLAGAAAGMFSTSRYAGSIVGTALLGSLLGEQGVAGYRAVFAMVLVAAAAATVTAFGLATRRSGTAGPSRGALGAREDPATVAADPLGAPR